jgi:hypothetical protein
MPALHSYDYALVRVVPRVERGEFVNVGVVLFSRSRRYLCAKIEVDRERLLALAPELDLAEIEEYLAAIPRVCLGGEEAGPIGRLSPAERFHWLVAPRSTVIQPSPVHSGLSADPEAALEDLMNDLVRKPGDKGSTVAPSSG